MKTTVSEFDQQFVFDIDAESMKDMAVLIRAGKMRKGEPKIWVTVFDDGTCNMHLRFEKNKRATGDIKRG